MKAYTSFAVQINLREVNNMARRHRIVAVPTPMIADTYETDTAQAAVAVILRATYWGLHSCKPQMVPAERVTKTAHVRLRMTRCQ
jgi:hypothetical protein